MKKLLIRLINATLIITFEVVIFQPIQIIICCLTALLNTSRVLGRFLLTWEYAEDGEKIVSFLIPVKQYTKSLWAQLSFLLGIQQRHRSPKQQQPEQTTVAHPTTPIDY